MHALTDYSYVPLVASAPELVGFGEERTAARLCGVFSSAILLSSLFTRAEWGPIPVVPYRAHLVLDFSAGVLALGTPWLFGFSRHAKARNTFLAMGVMGMMAGLLSEPEEMSHSSRRTDAQARRRR